MTRLSVAVWVTFPATSGQGPAAGDVPQSGISLDNTDDHTEGTLVGYRDYDANGQEPAYPFGLSLAALASRGRYHPTSDPRASPLRHKSIALTAVVSLRDHQTRNEGVSGSNPLVGFHFPDCDPVTNGCGHVVALRGGGRRIDGG